jgi:hypothetical protein
MVIGDRRKTLREEKDLSQGDTNAELMWPILRCRT